MRAGPRHGAGTMQQHETATVTVPEGHEVEIYRATAEPRLTRSRGGVWIANLGLGSDEAIQELRALMLAVEGALERMGRAPVLLASRAERLSDLFAPAEPAVAQSPGAVLWIVDRGSLAGWIEHPALREELLRRWAGLGGGQEAPLRQWVYFLDGTWSGARLLAPLLAEIGVEARTADEEGAVLVEVRRPEGTILSAAMGAPCSPAPAKADAEEEPQAPARAPRLGRFLLEAAQARSNEAWRALCEELLRRDAPLVVMASEDGAVTPRAWPGVGLAMPVYPDLRSVEQAAEDLGMAPGSVGLAAMPPRDLFAWAAGLDTALALNVYRDPSTPLHVFVTAEEARALAEGEIPERGAEA